MAGDRAKTDNGDLLAKLALRRCMLRKYHAERPPRVLDCCQGDGLIWSMLRREFELASYWGLDVKRKRGRLRVDSSRVLAQPGWNYDVVDIDTYGSPWVHWAALLRTMPAECTVLLTVCRVTLGGGGRSLGEAEKIAIGLSRMQTPLPAGFGPKLSKLAVSHCLATACVCGILLVDAIEAETQSRNAQYIAVRLKRERPGLLDPAVAEHPEAAKEPQHVCQPIYPRRGKKPAPAKQRRAARK